MATNHELLSMMNTIGFSGAVAEPARHRLSDLNVGERPAKGFEFCPWKLILRYPFMYQTERKEALLKCMRDLLFEDCTWALFYLLDPGPNRQPLLLVPSSQFKAFIMYVGHAMHMRDDPVPSGQERDKWFITFGEMGTPLPRFIGHADSHNAVESLRPQIYKLPIDDMTSIEPTALHHYMVKMDAIYATLVTNRQKRLSEAARLRRVERHKGHGRIIKRAQRYLGLRSPVTAYSSSRLPSPPWYNRMPVPFRPDGSVRFVCVDAEAWERAPDIVTEIGLAILDTRDIIGVPPGEAGAGYNWFNSIRAYHFRVQEHMDKVNRRFVAGCPDLFNFGQSHIISRGDMARVLSNVIEDKESQEMRPIVMVGHGIGQDLKYMKKVGYNIWNVSQYSDDIDTQWMFQRLEKSPDSRGLQAVCEMLDIPGRNFHNAGNDAVYTLRAMIAIAVNCASQPFFTRQNALTHGESDPSEWSDGSMDDGGAPQRSAEPIWQANSRAGRTNTGPSW
ncbi:hypothetical protein GGR52DRAFT_13518 [Hypoxylon sp. FL1284]|nr:hypothetical protein GGR52DRAFT_13518 [Hypoxylon sp. FL1284]